MNLNENSVACPLDCFDACEAVIQEGKIKGSKTHFTTNGKLCVNFAHLLNENFLTQSYLNNKKVSLSTSLDTLVEKLKDTDPSKTLFYKGAGNIGIMQGVTKTFFSKYGATFTKGGLCDEIGAEGLNMGRGKVVNPPIENLLNSEVIIVWGRNFSITSPHMYNLVKDKTFITIDPISTPIAKKSKLHIQLNPKTDHELALLLTRFAYMEDIEDEEFIKNHANGADWFFDLAKSRPLVSYEATTGVDLAEITKFFEIIKDKKISIMLGLGVQKYYEGAQIVRAIDSFAAYIGIHNKNTGGLWYLADSTFGYKNQFKNSPKKSVSIAEVDFSSYDLVFIQGCNPVVSSPNTKKIIEGLKNSFVVFFGTVLNETTEYADLIIPSSNFLTKKDVRLSYGHGLKAISNNVKEKDENTLSEYELTQYLNEAFSFNKLASEDELLSSYIKTDIEDASKIDSFEFIEELEIESLYEIKKENEFYFITAKRKDNLNSQFVSDNTIHLHPDAGFTSMDEVLVSSKYGKAKFIVSINENLKENCVLCYAGNKYANYLTPYKKDEEADSAIFQEVLVTIELS